MNKDELSAMTVAELKVRLKEQGLSTTGKKSELVARILDSTEDVLILDDDDEDESIESLQDEDDEILEAEVFEAEMLNDEPLDEVVETTTSAIKMAGLACSGVVSVLKEAVRACFGAASALKDAFRACCSRSLFEKAVLGYTVL